MSKYLLVVFLDPDERVVTRARTRDDNHRYCQICLRWFSSRFRYIDYQSIDSISAKEWSSITTLNVGCIVPSENIYSDLIIPSQIDSNEVWLITHDILLKENHIGLIYPLGIDYRLISYRPYANVHSNELTVLRFKDSKIILKALEYLNPFMDMTLIGWNGLPEEYFWNIEFVEGADLFVLTHFVNSKNVDSFIRAEDHLEQYWKFSIKTDSSLFSTFDPIYCMRRDDMDKLINYLYQSICKNYDCEVYLLPMNRSVMSNWFGHFEIPLIKAIP